jgi:hypothetical protein
MGLNNIKLCRKYNICVWGKVNSLNLVSANDRNFGAVSGRELDLGASPREDDRVTCLAFGVNVAHRGASFSRLFHPVWGLGCPLSRGLYRWILPLNLPGQMRSESQH